MRRIGYVVAVALALMLCFAVLGAAGAAAGECTTPECKQKQKERFQQGKQHEQEEIQRAKEKYEETKAYAKQRYEIERKGTLEAYACPASEPSCKHTTQERARESERLTKEKGHYKETVVKAKVKYQERLHKIKEGNGNKMEEEEKQREEEEKKKKEEEERATNFEVIKMQRLAGEPSYTTAPLATRSLPATVEYEVIVKDTGPTAVTVEKLNDTGCSGADANPAYLTLQPGEQQVEYRCSHELTSFGSYTNVAGVLASAKERLSNAVEVTAQEESFEVLKEQRLAGEATYTSAALSTHSLPATVEYEIVVKDTGQTPIRVEALNDSGCSSANATPEHETLQAGEEQAEYTCSHELTAFGSYTNTAGVTANGSERASNAVEVTAEE